MEESSYFPTGEPFDFTESDVVDQVALSEQISRETGIPGETVYFVLTWELALNVFRPQAEINLYDLAMTLSKFSEVDASLCLKILEVEDDIFWDLGINYLEE